MDIHERLTAFAGLGAGWILWLLVILSVISIAIVLERAYLLLTTREDSGRLRARFLERLADADLAGARKLLDGSRSYEARIVSAGVAAAGDGPDAAADRMAGEAQTSRLAMERNLAFLGTVGNNAPFVGLLGTVIGIINAFAELDRSAGRVSEGLMTEIGEALVATAIGLLVALPAVAFYNVFQRVVRGRVTRGDALGKELVAWLRRDGAGGTGPASEPAEPRAPRART